jgi:hypothetical protein
VGVASFGDDLENADLALASLRTAAAAESDETYLLSMYGDASVKVRGGLLDVKVLQRVWDRGGSPSSTWGPTRSSSLSVIVMRAACRTARSTQPWSPGSAKAWRGLVR